MASVPEYSSASQAIIEKLRDLRRSVVTWLVVDGLAIVALSALGLIVFDLAIDWLFRMDKAQRVVCLVLMAVTLGYIIWKRLLQPLARPMSDDMLALEVESRHRELGQSMISALQLARDERELDRMGISPELVRATIAQGERAGASIDFSDVVQHGRFKLNIAAIAGVVALFVVASVAAGDSVRTWINRNLLLGDDRWPQKTHLRLLNETKKDESGRLFLTLPGGDDLKLEVEVNEGRVPRRVDLDDWTEQRPKSTQSMGALEEARADELIAEDAKNKPRFEYTFKNVLEEFEFRIHGGDEDLPPVLVRLVDRPAVRELRLELTPPAYTGLQPSGLPPGKGPYEMYLGSRLNLTGTATKELREAKLSIIPRGKPPVTLPLSVSETDRTKFTAVLEPKDILAAAYEINLVDLDQRSSKRPEAFVIKITPDRPPSVGAKLMGISSMVVERAKIPVACTLADDFAITAANLTFRIKSADDPADAAANVTKQPFTELKAELGQPKILYTYPFEISELKVPIGRDIEFSVEATDNDAVSSPKSGQSQKFQVRVVTEDELRQDLLRREREQRKQFEEVYATQQDISTETRAITAGLGTRSMSVDDRANLLKVQKRQSQGIERCKMIAQWLGLIALEAENNRLEGPEGRYQKILREKIVAPLGTLAEKTIPQAARMIDESRRTADADVATRNERLQEAIAAERQVQDEMQEILRHMAKSEGFQEAVNMLHRVLDMQTGVSEETRRKLDELFRGSGDKKPEKKKP